MSQPVSHNTSRIVFAKHDPVPEERTKNIQQFFEDPDVFGFLQNIMKT